MKKKEKDVKKKQKNPIKVFISYSHDSEKHRKQVLELAKKLTKDGISCILDQLLDKGYPIEGWALWAERSILEADSVLIIYTEGFYNRLMGKGKEEEGRGVKWEATSIYNQIFKDNAKIDRFIPVLFNESDEQYIPPRLSGVPYYCVNADDGYKSLYLRLTNKSYIEEELEFPLPPKNEIRREKEKKESKNGRMKFIKYLIISITIFIASFILFDPLKIIKEKRQESMQSMKTEIGEDKQYPKYIDAVNEHINNEVISQFQRAMHDYNDGQYNLSKKRIERLIAILEVKGLEVEEKDILGKCYLLLGAIFEKEKNTELAEKNYRIAKDEYGIQSINGINLYDFKVFESVFELEKTTITQSEPVLKAKRLYH